MLARPKHYRLFVAPNVFSVTWLVILRLLISCNGGKVDVLKSLTTLKQNQRTGYLQVQLTEIVTLNPVDVTCTQLEFSDRITRVNFEHAVFPVNSGSGSVIVSIVSPGQPVKVSCYGVSLNGGSQYLQSNSSGKAGSIVVNKSPSVSICSDYIFVKGYSTAIQSFDVKLSEPAEGPVIIECFETDLNSSSTNSLKLEFFRAAVLSSQSSAKVSYRVVRSGPSVKVACRAQASSCVPARSSTVLIAPSTAFFSSNATINATILANTSSSNSAAIAPTAAATNSRASINTSSVFLNNTLVNATAVSANATINASQPTATISPTSLPTTPSPVLNLTVCQYLFNTSAGPSVTFAVEQPAINVYPQLMELQSLFKHVSFIVLDGILEGTVNMDLQCAIREASIGQLEQSVCDPATGLPVAASAKVVSSKATLELLESKITFKPGEMYKNITIQVKNLSNETFFQLFHAFCCAPISNIKYKGRVASVFLWIDSITRIPFTWTSVLGQSQRKITAVESLDFKCPCNLKAGQCDINCCCDQDCSTTEVQKFVCISGAFGGRQIKSFEFDCQAAWPDKKDWTPVLCVVTNNSPFLGYFFKYTSPALTSSLVDYNKVVAGKSVYDYEETEARNNLQSNTIGYTYGLPIRTNIGFLTLPSTFQDNSCLFTTVNYLKDTKSNCVQRASRRTCLQASFNALNYLMPTGMTFPACTAPGVLDGGTASSLVKKTVEYYCVKNASAFVFTGIRTINPQGSNESLFTGVSTAGLIARCSFDDSKSRPPEAIFDDITNTCKNAVFGVDYQMQWNGLQLKSVVAKVTLGSFPASTATLSPVTYTYLTTRVVTVTPRQTSSIASLTNTVSATAALSRTAVTSGFVTPAHFTNTARSVNVSTATAIGDIAPSTPSAAAQRGSVNNTAPLSSTNASSTRPAGSFRTSSAALATSTVSTPLTSANISDNKITVTVKTSTVILRNVTVVPSVMQKFTVAFSHVKALTSSANSSASFSVASAAPVQRSGNPGYVLGKPLITQIQQPSTSTATTTLGLLMWKPAKTGLCSESSTIPVQFGRNTISGCTLRFGVDKFSNCSSLVDLVKQSQDNLVKAINVSKRGNPTANVSADWLSIIRIPATQNATNLTRNGICHNIPAHLLIEILISEAGMSYGQSQMEISGIRIRYVTESWLMPCATGANSRCYNTSVASSQFTDPLLKTFAVTSTVSFITIPAVEPPGVKRSVDTSGICRYDACLPELFYPIREVYSAGVIEFNLVLTQNSTAMAMTLIFIAFGTLFVSRPWRN